MKTKGLRQLELQEFCEERLKEQATAPVAMELDGVTADSPELAKAVSEQVAKSTKSLQAQVSRLTNKLNEIKNKSPCTTKSSAQPKKKPDSSLQATDKLDRAKSKAATQKAAAVGKDSTNSNKRKTHHGKRKKSQKSKSKPNNSNS
jgi:hypothetical protein